MKEGHLQRSVGAAVAAGGELRTIAALLAIFWLSFQIVFFTYGTLARNEGDVAAGALVVAIADYLARPVELAIITVGVALSLGVYFLLRSLRGTPLWVQLMAAAGSAISCAACFTIAVSLLCARFDVEWPSLSMRFLLADSLRWLSPFGLWAGIALTVAYNSDVRERERQLALFQAQAREAQMRALRYQVNPHLLYNTLNAIASLILDRKNELAEAMVLRLSNFFRASLANDPHADVPLADEVALQQLYLDIEQMRFPNLAVAFDVPEELGQARVPSLILQPLIENVLRHGINPDGRATRLRVRARAAGAMLLIEVSDDGPGASCHAGTGLGLGNVEGRLRSRFGDAARVEMENAPGKGFLVRLVIPAGLA